MIMCSETGQKIMIFKKKISTSLLGNISLETMLEAPQLPQALPVTNNRMTTLTAIHPSTHPKKSVTPKNHSTQQGGSDSLEKKSEKPTASLLVLLLHLQASCDEGLHSQQRLTGQLEPENNKKPLRICKGPFQPGKTSTRECFYLVL